MAYRLEAEAGREDSNLDPYSLTWSLELMDDSLLQYPVLTLNCYLCIYI